MERSLTQQPSNTVSELIHTGGKPTQQWGGQQGVLAVPGLPVEGRGSCSGLQLGSPGATPPPGEDSPSLCRCCALWRVMWQCPHLTEVTSRFVRRLVVSDLAAGKKWHFPCDCWLAADMEDGQVDKVFVAASDRELRSFRYLLNPSLPPRGITGLGHWEPQILSGRTCRNGP